MFIQGPTFILFLLPNFPGSTFIPCPTSIPDSIEYFKKDLTPLYSCKIGALAGFNMQWYVQCSFPNMGIFRKQMIGSLSGSLGTLFRIKIDQLIIQLLTTTQNAVRIKVAKFQKIISFCLIFRKIHKLLFVAFFNLMGLC